MLLRVTLGDMPLQDAYPATVSGAARGESLGGLLGRLFPTPPSSHPRADAALRPAADSDSPAMYAEVSRMLYDARARRCALRFFVNHGPEIAPADGIIPHLRDGGPGPGPPLLDLVIEQRYTPLEYAVARGDWPGVGELVEWLEDSVALIEAGDGGARGTPGARPAAVALRLADHGLMATKASGGPHVITEAGRARLQELTAEAESYDERYAVFEDVLYDDEAEIADFGTGQGDDLRALVYEAEGLDPVRATFLVRALDWEDKAALHDGADAADPGRRFTALLAPAVDRPLMDDAAVERVVEAGLALVETEAEARQRDIARRRALHLAKRRTRSGGA